MLSPVGALNNGVELLVDETDPEMRERCLELLAESARVTANKLKFFRLAFGAAGGFGELIDPREAQVAIEGLLTSDGKIQLGWMITQSALSKTAVKVLMNLALIAGDALVRGGRLDVGAERRGNTTEIVIRAEGPRLAVDPEIAATLNGEIEEAGLTPRAAAAWLARSLSLENGGNVQVAIEDGVLVFGATLIAR